MLRNEEPIEMGDDIYARVVAEAARRGTSPDKVLEQLLNRALDRDDQAKHEAARDLNTKVICTCCGGPCKQQLSWRGRVRCGCPNGDRPDSLNVRFGVTGRALRSAKTSAAPSTSVDQHVYVQSVLEPRRGCALCKRPESDIVHDVGF